MFRTRAIAIFAFVICLFPEIDARVMTKSTVINVTIHHLSKEIAVDDLGNVAWKSAAEIRVEKYWSGESAPEGRRVKARMLWSDSALYVRFEARVAEPLVVGEKPDLTMKTMGLWDRDVVEIFVAPDHKEPRKYFEFEVAPTGEWLDVALDLTSGTRISDWKYVSRMESFAKVEKNRFLAVMKIPWSAFGRTPKAGDVWLGNLLRCVGMDPGRGYLAWRSTLTKEPAFHVPEKFGEFRFVD